MKVTIVVAGTEPFSVAGSARQATHYVLKVDIGGIAGMVAPLVGKQPPDSHVWILEGEAPAFVRSQAPTFMGGPVWQTDLVSPVCLVDDEPCRREIRRLDRQRTTMRIAYAILVLVVLQRVGELWYASRNTRALKARGAIEYGRGHYPLIVLLHASWLTAIAIGIQRDPAVRAFSLTFFVLLQALRAWVFATLGRYWTTRVITIPGAPLVLRGPYRFLRHPNYVVVIGEIALLPLVFGQVANAFVFSVLNGAALAWRIRVEEIALGRRGASSRPPRTRV